MKSVGLSKNKTIPFRDTKQEKPQGFWATKVQILLLGCSFVLLGFFTTLAQIEFIVPVRDGTERLQYIEEGGGLLIERHQAVIQGTAGNPWQYRIFSEYVIEGVLIVFKNLGISYPMASTFIFVRIVQDILIFSLAFLYYRRWRINAYLSLIGLSFLAWGMTYTSFESDLSFNTYFDVIFYLLAGLMILNKKYVWIIPITVLAAFNRETSGLIPVMLLTHAAFEYAKLRNFLLIKREVLISMIAFFLYAAIVVSLRLGYGDRPMIAPAGQPGLEMFLFNITRFRSWYQLFATLGLLPILAIIKFQYWPRDLKIFFWAIVPVWVVIHLVASLLAETRLFLVPHVLIFIPGLLIGIMASLSLIKIGPEHHILDVNAAS